MKKTMEELVLLAKAGDQEAISALYEQTYNSVYQSVRAIMKDEDEALDVLQDSYIKGFQSLDKLEDPEKFQPWMKQIAANQARDYLRKKRPVLFSERVNEEGEEIDLQHPDDVPENMPDEVIDRQETTRLMNDILSTLSQEQRLAISMFYYEELSIKEIAAALNCSENTVKSRLNYGRKKIEAAVRALEKQGTKLYSLAPLPFFLWLLRMAKGYGITAQAVAGTTAAGVAGAAAAAGETAAAASGTTTAGTAVGSSVATKVVAGVLAVSLTAGAGVAIANSTNLEKENEAAHIIYEDIIDRYRTVAEMGEQAFYSEYWDFWNEVLANTLQKYPDAGQSATLDKDYIQENADRDYQLTEDEEWDYEKRFDLLWGKDWEPGIQIPDSPYFPTMHGWDYADAGGAMYYAIGDVTGDKIDDLILFGEVEMPDNDWYFAEGWVLVHFAKDGKLYTAEVRRDANAAGEERWRIFPVWEGRWWNIDGRKYSLGVNRANEKEFPQQGESLPIPELEWKPLMEE